MIDFSSAKDAKVTKKSFPSRFFAFFAEKGF